MQTIFFEPGGLVAGRWYALAIRNLEGELDWSGARILRYDGEGCWSDETGEEIERIWDPIVENWCSPDAADAFALQS